MTPGALDPAVRKLAVAVLKKAARDGAGQSGVAAQARGWLQSRNLWLAVWGHCAAVAPEIVRRWDVTLLRVAEVECCLVTIPSRR